MNAPPEPPPVVPQRKPHRRFRFNTATLLGVMALVAVACTLAMSVPGLLAIGFSLVVTAALTAFAAFLIAGAIVAEGDRRIFAIAALLSLGVSFWGGATGGIALRLLDRGGLSWSTAAFVWSLLAPLQHIGLSLFGGWVALRAAKYWRQDSAESAAATPPPPPASAAD